MSIRLRLTMLYTAILVLVLTTFSLMLYTIQAQSLMTSVGESLALGAQRLASGRQRFLSGDERPAPPPPPNEPRPVTALYVQQLRDRDGEVIQDPENNSDIVLPLSSAALEAAQHGEPWMEVAWVDDERYMIYSSPVMVAGEVREVAQVGRSLAEPDQVLSTLRSHLLAGSGIVTFAAFGLGWGLAGLALRPIHRITRTAQAIGAERDVRRRVDYTGPKDELGQLATTFNAMLAELQAAHEQVEESLKTLRSFVADVSHELRTPLTTIRGNLALLRDKPLPAEEQDDILRDTVDESERLIRLVSDLLRLARAEAGRQLHSEPIALTPLIQDVCRKARLLDPSRIIRCDPLLDATVIGDRDALEQVLLALLDNALKHGEGTITVTARAEPGAGPDPSGRNVAIDVHDAGPGIEAEALPRLFERFSRGERTRETSGLGLGLSIARALMEAQHGALKVESQPGQGSVFTMILPRADRHTPALS